MDRPLSVSELLGSVKSVLHDFGSLAVVGEIGQLNRHRSGHWYFTLVDDQGTLNSVIFRGDNQRLGWSPQAGDEVTLIGGLDLYAPQGKLSFIARRIEASGAGARARALEAMKQKLAGEGLFDPERKQALPTLPKAIGIATSPSGAALQDILQVLERRYPDIPVYLAGCRVQGEGAAEEVAAALALLCAHGQAEVIIVGRGGGSAEDLWAFNEEVVVRAVAAATVPVVSAVGHETDHSLCDLAADLRAPTPSAAAELVVPEQLALVALVEDLEERLGVAVERSVGRKRERLQDLRLLHPGQRLVRVREQTGALRLRLVRAGHRQLEHSQAGLRTSAARLEALSPLAVLTRGYAIVTREGRAVLGAEELSPGEDLDLRFSRGSAVVRVQSAGPE